jgi:hypothetical protein
MSPLEAAVLVLGLDLRNLLRFAGELKRQGETLESFARLQPADMESVKTAIRRCDWRPWSADERDRCPLPARPVS